MQSIFRVGCIPTIAPFIMADFVRRCQSKYPAVKLLIREVTTNNLLRFLEVGQLDFVILALPYPIKNLHSEILYRDDFQLVLPQTWINKIDGKDIIAWPDESIFFLEKERCLTEHALEACSLKNSNKINPFFANSLYTLVQMVISELGISIFPKLAIKKGILANSNLVTLSLPIDAFRDIGVVWRISSHKHKEYQLLAELVKEVLSS